MAARCFGLAGPTPGGPGFAPAVRRPARCQDAVLPQIAPMPMGGQAAVPPPEAIQAAQGGDQAPAPLAAPGVEPQQAAAPAPQQAPAPEPPPIPDGLRAVLPPGFHDAPSPFRRFAPEMLRSNRSWTTFLGRKPSTSAIRSRIKELEKWTGPKKLMSVGGSIYDPETRKVVYQGAAHNIANVAVQRYIESILTRRRNRFRHSFKLADPHVPALPRRLTGFCKKTRTRLRKKSPISFKTFKAGRHRFALLMLASRVTPRDRSTSWSTILAFCTIRSAR